MLRILIRETTRGSVERTLWNVKKNYAEFSYQFYFWFISWCS